MCSGITKALLAVSLSLALIGQARAADVAQIRLVESDAGTQVVVEMDAEASYKCFTLQGPDRLVLDLDGAKLASGYRAPAPNGIVTSVRSGKPGADTLRLVFDLGVATVTPSARIERDGAHARLIVDLANPLQVHAAAPRPVAAMLPPPEVPSPPVVAQANPIPRPPQATVVPVNNTPANAAPRAVPAKTMQDVIGVAPRKLVVAIDAGHGGKDPGAHGPGGVNEKRVTLAIARELARLVNADPGMRAVLIRDDDTFVPLQDRYMRARSAQADLFISIHADASPNHTATGASVYVLSTRGASSQAARWLADQENTADLVGGVSLDAKDPGLAAVLLDLSQSATMRASDDVAGQVLASLKNVGKAHKPAIERANFVVLRSPDVPSMLVETGFITNPVEEQRLADPDYRTRLAAAIADGVRQYFTDQPPPGSWYAAQDAGRRPAETVSVADRVLVPVVVGTPK